jgi:hypothetical protein
MSASVELRIDIGFLSFGARRLEAAAPVRGVSP